MKGLCQENPDICYCVPFGVGKCNVLSKAMFAENYRSKAQCKILLEEESNIYMQNPR